MLKSQTNSSSPVEAGRYRAGSPGADPLHAIDALDRLTHVAQLQLGAIAQSAFFVGDGLQRAIIDRFFDLWEPSTWTPANLLRNASSFARRSLHASRVLVKARSRSLTLQEISNKLEVFVLVKNLISILDVPTDQHVPLPDLVHKAYSLPAFPALWAIEGVGHYYADAYWEHKGVPEALLSEGSVELPAKSLLMLHAGMGLAFADRLLGNLTSESSPEQVRDAITQFVGLCRRNSRSGYMGAALESLGLVTRDFYPEMLPLVNRELRATLPEFSGFFWHGVGRALYFSRKYFVPALTSAWSGVATETETDDERANAIAGLSWAITLVNMRQPGIMEEVLRHYVERPSVSPAFMSGVSSSIVMRTDTTPSEPFVSAFYNESVDRRDHQAAAEWQRCITAPTLKALQKDYPWLQRHNRLDQLFHFSQREEP